MPAMLEAPTLGVDVSRWQGAIGWRRVRKGNPDLRFAYIRAAGGRAPDTDAWQATDRYAADNLTGARGVGLVVGTYVPLNPLLHTPDDAAAQAVSYLAAAGGFAPGQLVPALDLEEHGPQWSRWVADFLDRWAILTGDACDHRVVVYARAADLRTDLADAFSRTDLHVGLWVADHNTKPGHLSVEVTGRVVLHQYDVADDVPGIGGAVPLDAVAGGARLTDWQIRA